MESDDFREFVEVRYRDLLRTAYLLTGSRDAAEDLVQGALLRVMRHWKRIDDPVAYVRRTMVNQRTSWWRRVTSRELLTGAFSEVQPDAHRYVEDAAERSATRDELLRALAELPVRMRAVLVLRYWEDLSEAQTAQLLSCSVGTVKSHASRGLSRIRAALAQSADGHTADPPRTQADGPPRAQADGPPRDPSRNQTRDQTGGRGSATTRAGSAL